jgi:predicted O-methyltransferase YrrM
MSNQYPGGNETMVDNAQIKAVLDTIPNEQYAVSYHDPHGKDGYRNPVREVVGEGLTALVGNLQLSKPHQIVGVELGTALGRSGLHMALGGMRNLYTVEFDTDAAETAKANFDAAGLATYSVYNGDSGEFTENYNGAPVDLLFVDHAKERYLPDFKNIESHLTDDALILMDNSFNRQPETKDAVAYVSDNYYAAIFTEPSSGAQEGTTETTGLLVASKSREVFDLAFSTLMTVRGQHETQS